MSHAELINATTDLLSETQDAQQWLPLYDAALSSPADRLLIELVDKLRNERIPNHRLAA